MTRCEVRYSRQISSQRWRLARSILSRLRQLTPTSRKSERLCVGCLNSSDRFLAAYAMGWGLRENDRA
jgi:hypothetical protein